MQSVSAKLDMSRVLPTPRGGSGGDPKQDILTTPRGGLTTPHDVLTTPRDLPTPRGGPAGDPKQNKDKDSEGINVHVCVRVRPFNTREKEAKGVHAVTPVVRMTEKKVELLDLEKGKAQPFPFDDVFWSMGTQDADGRPSVTQADVFNKIGAPMVERAFQGFNVCLFAYGQTGSGKTHSMMGESTAHLLKGEELIESDGLIPRVCAAIFVQKAKVDSVDVTWEVRASYVEVYNERVRDLLDYKKPNVGEEWLDVRQQKDGSFFVSTTLVDTPDLVTIMQTIARGRNSLHTAATKMNDRSSRSHSIFQLTLTERVVVHSDKGPMLSTGKIVKVNLVDLAGSERVGDSKVTGQQFTEATKINLSLTTLGRVIDSLADKSANAIKPPYRDSTLTKLLKDSLGGNSKTTMIATVSPSILNVEESNGTLRYASRAREIVNVAYINEDPKVRKIRKLEEELAKFRAQMRLQELGKDQAYYNDLEQKFALAQQELESRTADLRQVELEKQARLKAEEILSASETDKRRLKEEAAHLAQNLEASKKEREEKESELKKLRTAAADQDKMLLQKNKALQEKQGQLEELQLNLSSNQEVLQKTMADLEKEKTERVQILNEMNEKSRRFTLALQEAENTGKVNEELNKQKEAIERECAQMQRDLEARAKVIQDMMSLRKELERTQHEVSIQIEKARKSVQEKENMSDIIRVNYDEAVARHSIDAQMAEDLMFEVSEDYRALAQIAVDTNERLHSVLLLYSQQRKTHIESKQKQQKRFQSVRASHEKCEAELKALQMTVSAQLATRDEELLLYISALANAASATADLKMKLGAVTADLAERDEELKALQMKASINSAPASAKADDLTTSKMAALTEQLATRDEEILLYISAMANASKDSAAAAKKLGAVTADLAKRDEELKALQMKASADSATARAMVDDLTSKLAVLTVQLATRDEELKKALADGN